MKHDYLLQPLILCVNTAATDFIVVPDAVLPVVNDGACAKEVL